MKIIVTLPAYNEEKSIGKIIERIHSVMKSKKYDYEVCVLDDGSTDNTSQVAKKAGAKVYKHYRRFGLSRTFMDEMKICLQEGADVIVHLDSDGQHPPEYIPQLIDEIKAGSHLVIASRFKNKKVKMLFIKKIGNKLFSRVISGVTKINLTDTQSGFRAFVKDVAQIKIRGDYTYTQEQILKAAESNFKITEIPFEVSEREYGKSRLMKNPFDFAIRAFINLIRIYRDFEPLKFFAGIGAILFSLGLILGVFILVQLILYKDVTIPRVILSMLLMTMGLQSIFFGFLAEMSNKGD